MCPVNSLELVTSLSDGWKWGIHRFAWAPVGFSGASMLLVRASLLAMTSQTCPLDASQI